MIPLPPFEKEPFHFQKIFRSGTDPVPRTTDNPALESYDFAESRMVSIDRSLGRDRKRAGREKPVGKYPRVIVAMRRQRGTSTVDSGISVWLLCWRVPVRSIRSIEPIDGSASTISRCCAVSNHEAVTFRGYSRCSLETVDLLSLSR